MKKLILLFTLILSNALNAQNLVPNPSIEFYEGDLPFWMANSDLEMASPWFKTPISAGGGGWSVDYIHEDMPLLLFNGDTYDIQPAHSGKAYIKAVNCMYSDNSYFVETFQIRLEEPMVEGEIYQVSFYARRNTMGYGAVCHHSSDEIGIHFHTDSIFQKAYSEYFDDPYKLENYLEVWDPYTNQYGDTLHEFTAYLQEPDVELTEVLFDEDEWVLVTDTVYAHKAYEFMVFSRFSYYEDISWDYDEDCMLPGTYSVINIDDVSVYLVNEEHIEADAGVDATICLGDSIQIGTTEYEDYMYWWSPNEEIALDTFGYVNPGMPWVKPTVTTTYTLTQKDFAFEETTDEVTITVEFCPGFSVGETVAETIKIYPNPAKNFIEIESIHAIDSWRVLDVLGKEVASSKYLVSSKNLVLDVSSFDVGLYFLEMEVDDQLVIKQLMVD